MKKIILLLLLLPSLYIHAQQANVFRNKCIILRRFLEQNHYQPLTWNDSTSVRLYNKWIEKLDEEKLFFTQKDISALEPLKYKLDDELLGKDPIAIGWNFFNRSSALYKMRLQKTDSIIRAVMEKPFNFSSPDNFTWPCSEFPLNETDATLRWQRFLKWQFCQGGQS